MSVKDVPGRCAVCGATNIWAFQFHDGTVVCLPCMFLGMYPIPPRTPLDDIADDFDKAVDEAARGQGP